MSLHVRRFPASSRCTRIRLAAAVPDDLHTLWLRFQDDSWLYLDLAAYAEASESATLRCPATFRAAYLNQEHIAWPDGTRLTLPELTHGSSALGITRRAQHPTAFGWYRPLLRRQGFTPRWHHHNPVELLLHHLDSTEEEARALLAAYPVPLHEISARLLDLADLLPPHDLNLREWLQASWAAGLRAAVPLATRQDALQQGRLALIEHLTPSRP